MFVQQSKDSCLVTTVISGISRRLNGALQTLLEVTPETKSPFLVATVILGFLSIFNKSQASSLFEALNSASLLWCQKDVRPCVQMRQGPRAFSRFYTVIQITIHLVR